MDGTHAPDQHPTATAHGLLNTTLLKRGSCFEMPGNAR